jgi:chemotaxis response regulator CheB
LINELLKHGAVRSRLECKVFGGGQVIAGTSDIGKSNIDIVRSYLAVASEVGKSALGVILTGMGSDGADGLLKMRNAGAMTLAQDRETSVVWGMPGEAVKRGAAEQTLPLERVADAIVGWAQR